MGRRNGDTESSQRWSCGPGRGINAAAQRRVCGKREVEPLADPVGVDTDELAGGVQECSARRPRRERRGVLDTAVDSAATGTAEGACDGGDHPESDSRAATMACARA